VVGCGSFLMTLAWAWVSPCWLWQLLGSVLMTLAWAWLWAWLWAFPNTFPTTRVCRVSWMLVVAFGATIAPAKKKITIVRICGHGTPVIPNNSI
jgi:hypothetical protein